MKIEDAEIEKFARTMANAKLGEGDSVRCEGPTEFEINQARPWARRALASLSPAATPVSEAGRREAVFPADGELMVMENGHRSCDFERWSRGFELPLHMAESGLGRFYADDRTEWAWHSWNAALAKPSSPAGGDVREAAARVQLRAITALPDDAWAALNRLRFDDLGRLFESLAEAALSQSTSAGRVGE